SAEFQRQQVVKHALASGRETEVVRVPGRIQAGDLGPQRVQIGQIRFGDRAERQAEAVRDDRVALRDAFERVRVVTAAPQIVLRRNLEEGNVVERTVQHFFEELPAQPQADSAEGLTAARLGSFALGQGDHDARTQPQVPAPQPAFAPPAFFLPAALGLSVGAAAGAAVVAAGAAGAAVSAAAFGASGAGGAAAVAPSAALASGVASAAAEAEALVAAGTSFASA